MESYLLFVFGKISQEPYCLVFDPLKVSVGEEKLWIDHIMVVFRSSIWRLIVDHDFWRALSIKKQINFGAIGLIAKDSVLNRWMFTLTKSSLSPKESAMQPLIQRNFLASYLLIQIKLKSYIFEKIKLI